MSKTLVIILGLAIAVGLAIFAFMPRQQPPIVTTVEVPATAVAVTPPSETPPATPVETVPSTPADEPSAEPEPTPIEPAPAATPAETGVAGPDFVVATVNGTPITQATLDEGAESIISQYASLYAQMGQNFETMLVGADGFSMRLGIEAQALERLTFDAIADAEIASRGLAVTDDELNAEFEKQYTAFLESNTLTEESLTSILAAQGMSLEAFKESGRSNIKNGLAMQKLQVAVAGPVEMTPDEIQAYWEENKASYSTEEQVRASHILVETEDEAKAVLAELEGGADFAALAGEKSTDAASAKNGGDLGFFGSGTMVQEFEDAAFGLEVGQRSGIVATDYGFHIILVTDKKPATQPELADVQAQVETDAKQEIIDERANTWYSEVMAAADIVVNDPLLEAARQQKINAELGLEAYEAVRDSGEVDEPYVSYVIGTLYESRVQNLTRTKTQLEAATPPDAAKIAETTAQIDEARAKALAAYQEALAQVGSDQAIESRIQAVQSASATAE